MTRRTGSKWRIAECRSCAESHSGYTGKLDGDGVEYVVCGVTHKRMNVEVSAGLHESNVWKKEDQQQNGATE